MAPTKRTSLTWKEKVVILDKLKLLKHGTSQRSAAEQLSINRGTLQSLIKDEAKIRDQAEKRGNFKRKREGKDSEVEIALLTWFKFPKSKNMPVNGRILSQKAESLAQRAGDHDFRATEGWFSRWKKRHDLVFTQLKGEAADADANSAKNFRKTELQDILKAYDKKDILNADETGVYFRAMPDSTYILKELKKQNKGFKTAKDRVTLLVCCNMAGERESILLIGKSKNPKCLKHAKKLPLDYNFSSNAWMTGYI